jgi:hypothetical protein
LSGSCFCRSAGDLYPVRARYRSSTPGATRWPAACPRSSRPPSTRGASGGRRVHHGLRRDLRLVDLRHGLGPVRQPGQHPPELRVLTAGICTIVTCTLLLSLQQLDPQRLVEALIACLAPQ